MSTKAEDAKHRMKLDVARGKAIKAERDEARAKVGDKVPYPGHIGGESVDHEQRMATEMRNNRPRVITARTVQQALMDRKACPCCLAINGSHRSACLYRAFERANDQAIEQHESIAAARRFASELLRQLR